MVDMLDAIDTIFDALGTRSDTDDGTKPDPVFVRVTFDPLTVDGVAITAELNAAGFLPYVAIAPLCVQLKSRATFAREDSPNVIMVCDENGNVSVKP